MWVLPEIFLLLSSFPLLTPWPVYQDEFYGKRAMSNESVRRAEFMHLRDSLL
jgi:hypothetical protein